MKIEHSILLSMVAFFLTSCFTDSKVDYLADGYYSNIYKADSLYIEKEYEKSYEIFEKVFSKFDPIDMDVYNEVSTYVKLKIILDKDLKYKEYTDLMSIYGYPDIFLKKDSVLKIYYKRVKDKLDEEIPVLKEAYTSSLNMDLRNKILRMKVEDQRFRGNGGGNWDKQNKIDSINTQELINIFDTYGFPSKKMIGSSLVDGQHASISTLLLHTDDSIREHYFIPKILSYVREGKANPRLVGFMYDQLLLYNGDEQYYGTYNSSKPMTATPKEINQRRDSIGLSKLGYEDWRNNILYPDFDEY
ncbi:hypothetical protein U8527_03470 [Kordia algicida OT-1]|nr:hypothetical protein [Kordia algicida]